MADCGTEYASVFVCGSKARIVRRLKQIQLTNALAYFALPSVTKKKSFMASTPSGMSV
jgi:hypothetical protein